MSFKKIDKRGFTLVELVVVILVIAVLATATFLGGATVIKQARKSKVQGNLSNFATYAQDMMYSNTKMQNDTTLSAATVQTNFNAKYLTEDFQIGQIEDAWENQYILTFSNAQVTGHSYAFMIISSMGPNVINESTDIATGLATAVTTEDITSADAALAKISAGDDLGMVAVMRDGAVSVAYYGMSNSSSTSEQTVPAATPVEKDASGLIANDADNAGFYNLKAISAAIAAGSNPADYGVAIGDYIMVDGLKCLIADFNHDPENGETGITLVANTKQSHKMNDTFTNAGGWTTSEMRTWLNDTVLPTLTTINANAKTVTKKSDTGTNTTDSTQSFKLCDTQDKLWLLSFEEVFPSDYPNYTTYMQYVVAGQGTVYPIFTADNSSRTKIEDSSIWWMRSTYTGNSSYFRFVGSHGGNNISVSGYSYGAVVGFCI